MRTILLLFLSLTISIVSNSQSTNDSNNCSVNSNYIKQLATDFPKVIISPIKWSKREWFTAGLIAGTGVFLYSKDKVIAEWWQSKRNADMDKLNDYFFDYYGKLYYTTPLMGGLYLYGAFAKDNKSKRVAMDFIQATIYSSVIITVIKHLGHRNRPYQTKDLNPYIWEGPIPNSWGHNSFPSGHTITAFTFAAVVGTHYKKTIWVPILAYSLATLEGASRMYINKHWSSDVLIGGALGYAIGTFVVNQNHCKFKVLPIISSNYMGLGFNYPL